MRRLPLAIAALAMLSAACGGSGDNAAPTTTAPTTTAPVATGGAPLTGLPADAARLDRPALLVKIDNAPKGRPQGGINSADIVVEEMVEGGVTRLAVIFHSQDAGDVGPVRSFRTTDLALAGQLGKPLFAYSGANADFEARARSAPIVNVSHNSAPKAYKRVSGRPAPYNLFVDTAALRTRDAEGTKPQPWFSYRAEGTPSSGEPATGVSMEYRGRIVTAADWSWDPATSAWLRSQNGTPHVDAAGDRVAPKNVVVQFVEYHDTGYRDQSGEPVPEATLIGEGEVWVFSDGKIVKGRWRKADAATPTSYVDASGQPILLTPGQTWLELPKSGLAAAR
ncbi:MAG: DUF3048 domain-containing protein [Acidimicrobiales bacterium]